MNGTTIGLGSVSEFYPLSLPPSSEVFLSLLSSSLELSSGVVVSVSPEFLELSSGVVASALFESVESPPALSSNYLNFI